jgi:hypothetical protein
MLSWCSFRSSVSSSFSVLFFNVTSHVSFHFLILFSSPLNPCLSLALCYIVFHFNFLLVFPVASYLWLSLFLYFLFLSKAYLVFASFYLRFFLFRSFIFIYLFVLFVSLFLIYYINFLSFVLPIFQRFTYFCLFTYLFPSILFLLRSVIYIDVIFLPRAYWKKILTSFVGGIEIESPELEIESPEHSSFKCWIMWVCIPL